MANPDVQAIAENVFDFDKRKHALGTILKAVTYFDQLSFLPSVHRFLERRFALGPQKVVRDQLGKIAQIVYDPDVNITIPRVGVFFEDNKVDNIVLAPSTSVRTVLENETGEAVTLRDEILFGFLWFDRFQPSGIPITAAAYPKRQDPPMPDLVWPPVALAYSISRYKVEDEGEKLTERIGDDYLQKNMIRNRARQSYGYVKVNPNSSFLESHATEEVDNNRLPGLELFWS